jgi:peroxiredoxin family protein
VIIVKYSDSFTMTIGTGLVSSTLTSSGYKTTIFTAGNGNVSFA